jgi:hypothetical protein
MKGSYIKWEPDQNTNYIPANLSHIKGISICDDIFEVPTEMIRVDPARFAYKIQNEVTGKIGINKKTGQTGCLDGVGVWVPNAAGVLDLWRDPEDGLVYVIDGHNRFGLAVELGVQCIDAHFIDVMDAKAARAFGAKINIGKGKGTALDAAAYFREIGIGKEELYADGTQVEYPFVVEGIALAGLPDCWFDAVLRNPDDEYGIRRVALLVGLSELTSIQAENIYREFDYMELNTGINVSDISSQFVKNMIKILKQLKSPLSVENSAHTVDRYKFSLWELTKFIDNFEKK